MTLTSMSKNCGTFILILFGCFCFRLTVASRECQGDQQLRCFECNSHLDPRCRDPFNWTTMPPTKLCDGCCVKIVQGLDTPSYNIRRTCTSEIKINMFMVDHVCMSESNRRGKLCFCEDILCNDATNNKPMDSLSRLFRVYAIIPTLIEEINSKPIRFEFMDITVSNMLHFTHSVNVMKIVLYVMEITLIQIMFSSYIFTCLNHSVNSIQEL
jgi:hypothetical protein